MLNDLKAKNRAWAARMTAVDPGFFKRLALQQAPEYRLEVVNGNGSPVWAGLLTGNRSHLRAELPVKLAPGIYWVRLYVPSPAPLLLREYGLQVL